MIPGQRRGSRLFRDGSGRNYAVLAVSQLPFPHSLCHQCRYLRLVKTKNSAFLMCQGPTGKKYQPQPVVRCGAMEPVEKTD